MKFTRFTIVALLIVVSMTVATVPSVAQETLPRNETLYFNGQQWGSVVGWNPYSNSNNNAMAIAQQDNARVLMLKPPTCTTCSTGRSILYC